MFAFLCAGCRSYRAFRTGVQLYEERDYAAAAQIFSGYLEKPRYAPAAQYFLARIQLSGVPGLADYLLTDDKLADADSMFRLLKPNIRLRYQRRYGIDTSAFNDLRERLQRQLIAHVRVRGTLSALDSLLDGLRRPLPALLPALGDTRLDIVDAHLDSEDYDILTDIAHRHLAFVKPAFYSKSRRLPDRLWQTFQDKYSLCRIDKFAADHPRSFAGRDCWGEDIRPILCRNNLAEMLDFHANNRWTAFESVLLNALADASAAFSDTSLARDAIQVQHLRDLSLRSSLLARLRNPNLPSDTSLLLRQGTDYIVRYAPRYSAFRLMEEMLQFFLEKQLYSSSIQLLSAARPFFPDTLPAFCKTSFDYQLRVKPWIDAKLPILEKPLENLKKTPLDRVNTPEGDEFSPVLSADGTLLYFGASGRAGNQSGEDVFVSRQTGGEWSAPELVPSLSGEGNQYPLSLAAGGRQMLLSVNGTLCISRLNDKTWSTPTPLPVSGIPVIGKGVFSEDGNMIALEGSYSAGDVLNGPDMDIFLMFREASGQWGRPMALGAAINTEEQEGNPYLSADGQTLYYTSAGYPGLGRSDVFVSCHTGSHWANDWTRARNLGKEVNDTWSHAGITAISPDGKTAYFAQKQPDSDKRDIWLIALPADCRPTVPK